MKDLIKNIRSKGRMDAKNSLWVAELLGKDCEKAWTHTVLKECEEALPRLKEGDLDKASKLHKAKTGVGCDGFHPKSSFGLVMRNERRNCLVLGEGGTKW